MNLDAIGNGRAQCASAGVILSVWFIARHLAGVLCLLAILLAHEVTSIQAAEPASPTPRVASGDITFDRAIIWGQTDEAGEMEVEYAVNAEFLDARRVKGPFVDASADFSGHIELESLAPATRYFYRVSFRASDEHQAGKRVTSATGTFRTAPLPASPASVRFLFSGDLGGQGYCRHAVNGYRIFSAMREQAPDFFVQNGDFIYADSACPVQGPDGWSNVPGRFPKIGDASVEWTDRAAVSDIYRHHWRYQLEDDHLSTFLRHVPVYAQWDDHEVINDAGWVWDYWNADSRARSGFPNLVQAGREAFFRYLPLRRDSRNPERIYRHYAWGKDLDVILVDGRSYRSRNDAPDGPGKTLLGPHQLAWLKDVLLHSTATWKVVSVDVPLSVPTGGKFGRDAWANGNPADQTGHTGFEHELLDLLRFLEEQHVKNVVFLAADVHFAAQIRYAVDLNQDGEPLIFHELIAGPLAAVRRQPPLPSLDPTLHPTVLYSEGGFFNFGSVAVTRRADGLPHLIAQVHDENGQLPPNSTLDLTPR